MASAHLTAAFLTLCTGPTCAAAEGPLDRLRALTAPPPAATDLYAGERAADLALIASEAGILFGPDRPALGPAGADVVIALFVGPDCADCERARAELAGLAERLGVRANLFDTSAPEDAALMRRLTLDLLPSYVLPGGLIRGAMPAVVLERDLRQ